MCFCYFFWMFDCIQIDLCATRRLFFLSSERLKVCPGISEGGGQCTSLICDITSSCGQSGSRNWFFREVGDSLCQAVNLLKWTWQSGDPELRVSFHYVSKEQHGEIGKVLFASKLIVKPDASLQTQAATASGCQFVSIYFIKPSFKRNLSPLNMFVFLSDFDIISSPPAAVVSEKIESGSVCLQCSYMNNVARCWSHVI